MIDKNTLDLLIVNKINNLKYIDRFSSHDMASWLGQEHHISNTPNFRRQVTFAFKRLEKSKFIRSCAVKWEYPNWFSRSRAYIMYYEKNVV